MADLNIYYKEEERPITEVVIKQELSVSLNHLTSVLNISIDEFSLILSAHIKQPTLIHTEFWTLSKSDAFALGEALIKMSNQMIQEPQSKLYNGSKAVFHGEGKNV